MEYESSWMIIELLSFSKKQVLHSEFIKIRRNWMLSARGGCIYISSTYPFLTDPQWKQESSLRAYFPKLSTAYSLFHGTQNTEDKQNHFIVLIIIAVLYIKEVLKDCLVHLPVLKQDSKIDTHLKYPYPASIASYPSGQKIILFLTHSKCHLFSWKLSCFSLPYPCKTLLLITTLLMIKIIKSKSLTHCGLLNSCPGFTIYSK